MSQRVDFALGSMVRFVQAPDVEAMVLGRVDFLGQERQYHVCWWQDGERHAEDVYGAELEKAEDEE